MSRAMIDTSIFIDYLRGKTAGREVVISQRAHGPVRIHAVVAAELIAGALNKRELRQVASLVGTCELVIPDESDLRRSVDLLGKHHLASRVEWNDCVIAATASRLGVEVLTRNDRHFAAVRGVRVVRPY